MMKSNAWSRKLANDWKLEIAAMEADAMNALDGKSARMKSTGGPAKLIVSTWASGSTSQISSRTCSNIIETCENEDEVAGAEGTSSQNYRESSSSSDSILDLSEYDMFDEKDLQEISSLEESFTTTIEAQVRTVYNYVKQTLCVDPRTPRFEKRPAYMIPMSHVERSDKYATRVLSEPLEFQESHFVDKGQ